MLVVVLLFVGVSNMGVSVDVVFLKSCWVKGMILASSVRLCALAPSFPPVSSLQALSSLVCSLPYVSAACTNFTSGDAVR